MVLATVGYSGIGFGIATDCTNLYVALHACDAMYRWFHTGMTWQWAPTVVALMLLVIGLLVPASRKVVAIGGWAMIAIGMVWFAFYMAMAVSTF